MAPSAPNPRAIGSAPKTAASVVIRIGRKRSMLASWIAFSAVLAAVHAVPREVDDHDAVLLDDPHQHEHARRRRRATPARRRRRASAARRPAPWAASRAPSAGARSSRRGSPGSRTSRTPPGSSGWSGCAPCPGRSGPRPAGSRGWWEARPAAAALLMKSVASPIATPGFRLKKNVTLVNWLRWLTDCGPSVVFHGDQLAQRNQVLPVVGLDVEQRQILRLATARCPATSRMTWYWSVGFLIR